MAEHNDHGFMATKENAAPLKAATIERAMAMNEKSVSFAARFKTRRGARRARALLAVESSAPGQTAHAVAPTRRSRGRRRRPTRRLASTEQELTVTPRAGQEGPARLRQVALLHPLRVLRVPRQLPGRRRRPRDAAPLPQPRAARGPPQGVEDDHGRRLLGDARAARRD